MFEGVIKEAKQAGFTDIITTSHYIENAYDVDKKNRKKIIDAIKSLLKDENIDIKLYNGAEAYITNNLLAPVITAINDKKMTSVSMSQLNLQYNMDKVTWQDFPKFKEKVLSLFETLEEYGLTILHIAKLGKKEEDLLYKIVNILNKKQLKLPERYDEQGNLIPLPVVSWYGAIASQDLLEIAYEINDKYSFDFTKNYHTTEFYLNKMLYILENDYESDIDALIEKGEF